MQEKQGNVFDNLLLTDQHLLEDQDEDQKTDVPSNEKTIENGAATKAAERQPK